MTLRITFNGVQAGANFQRGMKRRSKAVREALRLAAQEVADTIVTDGRNDIASAGNFGGRWLESFQARVGEGGGNIRISVSMGSGGPPMIHWRVFQYGAVIHGRPLLWIPLSFASDAKGVNARDYPGQLFRVNRAGKAPLLLASPSGEPKYFGKEEVTIPKKFHLIEIAKSAARNLGAIYRRHFKELSNGG